LILVNTMNKLDFFIQKRISFGVFVLLLLAITYITVVFTEYNVAKGFTSIPKAIRWATANFYPDIASFKKLPTILQKLQDTILMSVSSATIASFCAFFVAIFGAQTTRINAWFSVVARGIATVFRNIDVSAWALILLFSFGQSGFTGFFALFFVTFGFMVRVLIETIDEVSTDSVEALRATGATYFAIIAQSVIPSCLPQLVSWVLFMIETNIRSATLIGILTGTGIGNSFDIYYKNLNYHAASLVIVVIVISVFAIEAMSNRIRRAVL